MDSHLELKNEAKKDFLYVKSLRRSSIFLIKNHILRKTMNPIFIIFSLIDKEKKYLRCKKINLRESCDRLSEIEPSNCIQFIFFDVIHAIFQYQ